MIYNPNLDSRIKAFLDQKRFEEEKTNEKRLLELKDKEEKAKITRMKQLEEVKAFVEQNILSLIEEAIAADKNCLVFIEGDKWFSNQSLETDLPARDIVAEACAQFIGLKSYEEYRPAENCGNYGPHGSARYYYLSWVSLTKPFDNKVYIKESKRK